MKRDVLLAFYQPARNCRLVSRRLCFSSYTQERGSGIFQLEETQGRPWKLFLSPRDTAIAHCVSSDFQMHKGIAKQFLKKYGNFDELLEKGMVFPYGHKVGKIGVLETKERYVYYLITRNRWWDPASYSAMENSLDAMRVHCDKHNVKSLALPRLGAQNDRLEWNKVKELILDIFRDSSMSITAYMLR